MTKKEEKDPYKDEQAIVRKILALSNLLDWGDKIRDAIINHLISRWYGED